VTVCTCQAIYSLSNKVKQHKTEQTRNVSGNILHRKSDMNLKLHFPVRLAIPLLHHRFGISLEKS